jgi:hypothetical protein
MCTSRPHGSLASLTLHHRRYSQGTPIADERVIDYGQSTTGYSIGWIHTQEFYHYYFFNGSRCICASANALAIYSSQINYNMRMVCFTSKPYMVCFTSKPLLSVFERLFVIVRPCCDVYCAIRSLLRRVLFCLFPAHAPGKAGRNPNKGTHVYLYFIVVELSLMQHSQ